MKEPIKKLLKRVCHTEHSILPLLKGRKERELQELIWDAYDLLTRDQLNGARKPRREKTNEEHSS